MIILMSSRSSLKLGHVGSKISSPGQIGRKPCYHSSGHSFEAVIFILAQNICLDKFQDKFESGSPGVKN